MRQADADISREEALRLTGEFYCVEPSYTPWARYDGVRRSRPGSASKCAARGI